MASALDLDAPESLYRPPGRPSIDAVLKDTPDTVYQATLALARTLTGKKAS